MITPDTNKKVKEEEIISLISEKGSHLVMEQLKTMLETKTNKMEEELNYIHDRLEKANIRLKSRDELIRELEPKVFETANTLNEYRVERDALAKEIKKLEGIEEKTFQLTERKALIESKTDSVGKLIEKQKKLRLRFNENLIKKDKVVDELQKNTDRRNSLNEHITALKARKEMIISTIPAYSSPNELKVKKGEAEKDILEYSTQISIINKQLITVNKKVLSTEQLSQKKLTEKDALSAQQNTLQDRLAELETIENREMLTAEVDELNKHKQFLTKDIKDKGSDLKRIASEIDNAKESIEKEKDFTSTAGPRLEDLMVQKGEIDDADSVIKMSTLNIAVNARFQGIVKSVITQLGPFNKAIGSLSGKHKTAVDGIIKKIKRGSR